MISSHTHTHTHEFSWHSSIQMRHTKIFKELISTLCRFLKSSQVYGFQHNSYPEALTSTNIHILTPQRSNTGWSLMDTIKDNLGPVPIFSQIWDASHLLSFTVSILYSRREGNFRRPEDWNSCFMSNNTPNNINYYSYYFLNSAKSERILIIQGWFFRGWIGGGFQKVGRGV